jgi:asparagine synthase (glutamine-hydrolysing)
MRNQLLRDSDWAGMAHSLEIRVPLVDVTLLRSLAPAIVRLQPGAGKAALAKAPSLPLADEIIQRAKTGFSVPTGSWIGAVAKSQLAGDGRPKGIVSRRWSHTVLTALNPVAAL